jgi:hypothetical protein
MKTFQLNDKKINIRTDVSELKYSDTVAFKQYFAKVIYDIDENNLDILIEKLKTNFDKSQYADLWLNIYNWYTSIKTLQIGGDAWVFCFGILIDKEKIITDERPLIELVQELEEQGLTEKEIFEAVENFTKAFPLLNSVYQLRAEGLNEIINQFSKNV